jgi:hypothetical protein
VDDGETVTYTSLIRFAPLATPERINSASWKRPGRTMYDFGALTFLPGKSSVPLFVNHDKARQIGVVTELMRLDDIDGPWLAALATITDRPCWLERGTRCSFAYASAGTSHDFFGCQIVRRGLVSEVSVLSPDRTPAEPLASVWSLRRAETTSSCDGEVIYHAPGTVLRRVFATEVTLR